MWVKYKYSMVNLHLIDLVDIEDECIKFHFQGEGMVKIFSFENNEIRDKNFSWMISCLIQGEKYLDLEE